MRLASYLLSAVVGLAAAAPALSHEFWIEPQDYQVDVGDTITANLVNGQQFGGTALGFFENRFTRFDLTVAGQTPPVIGRLGDRPALAMQAQQDGLYIYSYASTISRVRYQEWAKFQSFADHKDFADMRARHDARALPEADFWEAYSRFAKTLIAVGDGAGADQATGLETEFVMLTNPYVDPADTVDVQLFYQGNIRADVQIELFEKASDGSVAVTLHRTNAQGIGTLPVQAGHSYLVDAVVLREPSAELAADKDVVWETLWASLTFRMPD
jgi:hypothetical protein